MDFNQNNHENYFTLIMKKKTESKISKDNYSNNKNNSIRNLSLCKQTLFTKKYRNILSAHRERDKQQHTFYSNKQKYSASFNEQSQKNNQNKKIDQLQLKIKNLINIIDNFKEQYLNDNENIKKEFNMLLSHSSTSLKLGKHPKKQKIPTSQSLVSDTTNFSSRENISNEDKNKIQSTNQNTRQINKKKLSEIDIQQIRNLFKQKQFIPFTKTVNHFSNNKAKFSSITYTNNKRILKTKETSSTEKYIIKPKLSCKHVSKYNLIEPEKEIKKLIVKNKQESKKNSKTNRRLLNIKNDVTHTNRLRNSCTQIKGLNIFNFDSINLFKTRNNRSKDKMISTRCRSQRTGK